VGEARGKLASMEAVWSQQLTGAQDKLITMESNCATQVH
jgi:hypothetical protein